MWLVLSLSSPASAAGCTKVSVGTVASVPSPSVLVLGERRGTLPDLSRAGSIVGKLAAKGKVTVALQAVDREFQPALDEYSSGALSIERLPTATDWANRWGFPFEAYEKLFTQREKGVKYVAIGTKLGLKPADAVLNLPPGYMSVLADAMGESPVPVELETTTVETMAWTDASLAAAALAGWDQQGVLVVVVDRLHVEGGLGVDWQLQRLTEVPVSAALLANGDSRCYAGDRLLP